VTTRDRQLTLAVYPVQQGISKVGYIARCLDQIAELGLTIEVLRLDREFYTKKVVNVGLLFPNRVGISFPTPLKVIVNHLLNIWKPRICWHLLINP
jgi:hypothetical protein